MEKERALGPAGILALNPEGFREIDGVVLDLESYEKHRTPPAQPVLAPRAEASVPPSGTENTAAQPPSHQPAPNAAETPEQGVFPTDPVHIGWYEPAAETEVRYPVMGGAVYAGGSGSGSYLGSWLTSYLRSSGSWRWGSGSGSFYGSGVCCVGGYGLELI